MRILNYLNLNQHPVQCSFSRDRTEEFAEIYHAHQGMELLYIHEGHMRVIVNQQIFDLSAGELIFFRPFQLHRIQLRLGAGERYVRTLFVFEPSELERFLAPFSSMLAFLRRLWKDPAQLQVFKRLPQEETRRRLEDYRARIEGASSELLLEEQALSLVELLRHLKAYEEAAPPLQLPASGVQGSIVSEQVMQWVEEHYMEEFQLDLLAKALHLTPNHVSAVFRQTTGSTITEYLTARRIRQACWLLKSGSRSVEEIGRSVGLQNSSYFCQLFKKHVGLSPYRFKRS
jgi:AraC family transcriptional regulator, arabinose operon regulatory protein